MTATDPLRSFEISSGIALKRNAFLTAIALLWSIAAFAENIDSVLVDKSDEKLYLLQDGTVVAEYSVAFGANPQGHKQQEGDERTPEGHYLLDYKKADSAFYKAIHISYPNDADKQAAAAKGVDPGGAIMIHGQRNWLGWLSFITQRFNWTDGCIAVTNSEMDKIWDSVALNTPIEIRE
jgi:murein L,D-transpeptidase YafK